MVSVAPIRRSPDVGFIREQQPSNLGSLGDQSASARGRSARPSPFSWRRLPTRSNSCRPNCRSRSESAPLNADCDIPSSFGGMAPALRCRCDGEEDFQLPEGVSHYR